LNTEVKRCFVTSERGRFIAAFDRPLFLSCLQKIEREVSLLNDEDLDLEIDWQPRRNMFNLKSIQWTFKQVSIDTIGVWVNTEGSGGLSREWCIGSVKDTANAIKNKLTRNISGRVFDSIPGIIRLAEIISIRRMLSIIVVTSGLCYPRRHRPCRKVEFDIDDGCMRAISLALIGQQHLNAFIGTRKQIRVR
jgi:hypothetical protein